MLQVVETGGGTYTVKPPAIMRRMELFVFLTTYTSLSSCKRYIYSLYRYAFSQSKAGIPKASFQKKKSQYRHSKLWRRLHLPGLTRAFYHISRRYNYPTSSFIIISNYCRKFLWGNNTQIAALKVFGCSNGGGRGFSVGLAVLARLARAFVIVVSLWGPLCMWLYPQCGSLASSRMAADSDNPAALCSITVTSVRGRLRGTGCV